MKQALILGTAAITAATAGCVTHRWNNRDDVSKLPRSSVRLIAQAADNPTNAGLASFTDPISLDQPLEVLDKYDGELPAQDINLYLGQNYERPGLRKLRSNTTGHLNVSAFSISELEKMMLGISENAQKSGVSLASPDAESYRARSNQLSTNSGLLGIQSISEDNNYYQIFVNQITGPKGFRLHDKYQVTVVFGQPDLSAKKSRKDNGFLMEVAGDALIGWGITGEPIGAAFGAGIAGVQGIEAYCKGKRPVKRTFLTDDQSTITGLSNEARHVSDILHTAYRAGATDVVVVNYNQPNSSNCESTTYGTGIVFGKDLENVARGPNSVYFETNQKGINWLCAFARQAAWGALYWAYDRGVETEDTCNRGGGRGGEGPGGTGVGGGQRRGGSGR